MEERNFLILPSRKKLLRVNKKIRRNKVINLIKIIQVIVEY